MHAERAFLLTSGDSQAFAHTANGPYDSVDDFVSNLIQVLAEDEYAFTFAIIDKSKCPSAESEDGEMVGMISLCDANPEDRAVEIGHVHVFSGYRGMGIATAATRLLLAYLFGALDDGGLGLYRAEWHTSTKNLSSIAVAEKLRLEKIGLVRYERVFKDGASKGKIGNGGVQLPRGSSPGDLFRDLVMFAVYWDTWQGTS